MAWGAFTLRQATLRLNILATTWRVVKNFGQQQWHRKNIKGGSTKANKKSEITFR